MYYEVHGHGEPLYLVHGAFGTAERQWKAQIPIFSKRFKVIAMDLRCHGRTDNPLGEISLEQLASDTIELTKALRTPRIHLCGYSLGGCVALLDAIRYPKVVESLVLWGANYRVDAKFLGAISRERRLMREAGWASQLRMAHSCVYDEGYFEKLVDQLGQEAYTRRSLTKVELKKIEAPTLIALGDRDELVSLSQALEMHEAIQNSELFVLPSCSQALGAGRTEIFDSVVLDFLARHSLRAGTQRSVRGGRLIQSATPSHPSRLLCYRGIAFSRISEGQGHGER